MTTITNTRTLAFAPCSRGLGYAVLEGNDTLVDYGVKTVKGDKSPQSLAKARELIALYRPDQLVLEDCSAPGCRRAKRIKELCQHIGDMAKANELAVSLLSRKQVHATFQANTKHAVAELLAEQFPEDLADRLPPKRRFWDSQDPRMDMFDAVALAVAFRERQARRKDGSGVVPPKPGA